MNIVVFDTETIGLNKPFCYNIGYLIYDTDTKQIVLTKEYIVEQVWHNQMLLNTAYYADKKVLYIKDMKARKIIMDKFGYICQQMIRDFKAYNVTLAYAYNHSFDMGVFEYNCDWFKCNNPFDNIEVLDIRGYVHVFIAKRQDFQEYCENYKKFTEAGNYSTTAETVFQYITKDCDFIEAHTALADSQIELEILLYCFKLGAKLGKEYKTLQSIVRKQKQVLTVIDHGEETKFEYTQRRNYKNSAGQVDKIVLK